MGRPVSERRMVLPHGPHRFPRDKGYSAGGRKGPRAVHRASTRGPVASSRHGRNLREASHAQAHLRRRRPLHRPGGGSLGCGPVLRGHARHGLRHPAGRRHGHLASVLAPRSWATRPTASARTTRGRASSGARPTTTARSTSCSMASWWTPTPLRSPGGVDLADSLVNFHEHRGPRPLRRRPVRLQQAGLRGLQPLGDRAGARRRPPAPGGAWRHGRFPPTRGSPPDARTCESPVERHGQGLRGLAVSIPLTIRVFWHGCHHRNALDHLMVVTFAKRAVHTCSHHRED